MWTGLGGNGLLLVGPGEPDVNLLPRRPVLSLSAVILLIAYTLLLGVLSALKALHVTKCSPFLHSGPSSDEASSNFLIPAQNNSLTKWPTDI